MNLTQREKLLLGILAAAVVLYFEYTYLLKGQLATLAAAQSEKAAYEMKLEALNNAEVKGKALDADIAKAMEAGKVVLDKYFSTTEQEEVILLMNDLLANSGMSISKISFTDLAEVKVRDIPFRKTTLTLDYSGTYDSLFNFMKKVWNFQKQIVIANASMDGSKGEPLTGVITLDLYYLTGHEGTEYKDNLYQMLIDENFFKGNPFVVSPGAGDFRMNYVFIGGKEPGAQAYTPFADIAGHWAEKEINSFGEKGYLLKNQENTFGPDTPMTRGEFVIMLDKIYQWPVPAEPVDLTKFTDYSNLGSYENAMSKAVLKGLLGGYVVGFTDQTLRPRDPITYEEAEFIVQKIKGDASFKWEAVSAKLLEEKTVTSPGAADKKGNMTKAEAVYMMTHFK